jgi:hypothetical protein
VPLPLGEPVAIHERVRDRVSLDHRREAGEVGEPQLAAKTLLDAGDAKIVIPSRRFSSMLLQNNVFPASTDEERLGDDNNRIADDDIDRNKSYRRRRVCHSTGVRSRSTSTPEGPFG